MERVFCSLFFYLKIDSLCFVIFYLVIIFYNVIWNFLKNLTCHQNVLTLEKLSPHKL